MKLLELVENLILESHSLELLKQKYVGEDKPISEEVFKKIEEVCLNKFNLIAWLTVKVANNIILSEDVYKYKEYFGIFERNKNKFPIKDIHQYKTKDDVQNFINKVIEIREKNVERSSGVESENKENYVSSGEMDKLESVGIKFLGMSDGYQVFEIPNELKDDEGAWKVYKDVLGRCSGREQGAKIDICTMANVGHFKNGLKNYPGSSYFVIFNLSDPKSPYQIHFESNQFMDKNDSPLL